MTVVALIQSLRSKKQTASRSAFQEYLGLVRDLAAGQEVDGGGAESILAAASKDESDLERDVQTQTQRLSWHAQLMQGRQAAADRASAEKDLARAQQALQEAYDRLMPAVDAAQSRMQTADQVALYTQQAEHRLTETILDVELLEREAAVVARLQDCNAELRPLQEDRAHKADSLSSAELRLQQMTGRDSSAWPGFGSINPNFWRNRDLDPARERVADLKSQVAQLDSAIAPRLRRQQELQNELSDIHRAKLEP